MAETANISPQVREVEGRTEVWDIVRKRYVALTPEEWVRQQLVLYLHQVLHYPIELMQVEGTITLNGLSRRCDVVVYNEKVRPVMIVECKKPEVALNQKVVDQICRYNQVLQVPYLCLFNGKSMLCFRVDFVKKGLIPLLSLPEWNLLNS